MVAIREKKRHSVAQVARICCVPRELVKSTEEGKEHFLDFLPWIAMASYYGRAMLKVPFTVHRLEMPVHEVYSMHLKNGEPVQYAAKEAFRLLVRMEEC